LRLKSTGFAGLFGAKSHCKAGPIPLVPNRKP
jgi:hypothetical protein